MTKDLGNPPQMPPNVEVFSLCASMVTVRALWAAAELGVADQIAGDPVSIDKIATATGAHADTLYRILRLLAANGIFREHPDRRFSHTPQSETLREDHSTKTRAAVRLIGSVDFWNAFANLHKSAKTGETGWKLTTGMGFFEWLPKHPEAATIFNDAMIGIHGGEPPAVAEAYLFNGTVVDVGGGSGNMLIHILKRYPEVKGTLFELAHVADAARANLDAAGVANRCVVQTGNFFESVPSGGDIYLLSHIIHDWDEPSCVKILSNCRKAKNRGGKVLLVEMVVPAPNQPHPAKELDLVMLTVPGGRERSEAEYGQLLEKAGLKLSRVIPTKSPVSIIEAQ
jgi:SAM-dependent methyltransferase